MKLLFWILALFSAAVAVALAANNPGYLLLVYPPYRIELSLTLFVLLLLALLLCVYLLSRLVYAVLNLPGHVRNFREQRALNRGKSAMMAALAAFFEGRFAEAEKFAVRAMAAGDKSALAPVIAARSAHELREFAKRDSYLSIADEQSVEGTTMRQIARAEFMLDAKQAQLALNALKALDGNGKHRHLGALHLELKAQQQARNWDAVLELLAQLKKRSALDAAVATQIQQQAWLEKLRAQTQDLKALQLLWKSMPDELRHQPKIAALAATNLIRLQDCKSARQLLTECLDTQWDSELVTLFGDCQDMNFAGQIEQAEKWLKSHSNDAGLLLALGKLCLHHGLWGKAQSYLDASNSLHPSKETFVALSQLSEKLHKPDEAIKYQQKAKTFQ